MAETPARREFSNPIAEGADPWIVRHGDSYYWCLSDSGSTIAVWKSAQVTSLGQRLIVWRAPADGPYSRQVWAPELHRLDGRWYIYVAASDGENRTHRMIVLESVSDEPTGSYILRGELYTGDDPGLKSDNRWAIDGTILEHGGTRYLVWSGWPGDEDVQCLYIAPLRDPWTVARPRVRLCANDDHPWEHVDDDPAQRGLLEAPQVLARNGRTFIVYSCAGAWLKTYKLGLLELRPGGNPLEPGDWRKHPQPVFAPTAETPGVGHCSFIQSADGREDWIIFHAKVESAPGWRRAIFVQPFSYSSDTLPQFGAPMAWGACTPVPVGEQPDPPIREVDGFSERLAGWAFRGTCGYPQRAGGRLRISAAKAEAGSLLARGFDAVDVSLRVRVTVEAGAGRAGVLIGATACGEPADDARGNFVALDAANARLMVRAPEGRIVAEAPAEIRAGRAVEMRVDIAGGRGMIALDGRRVLDAVEWPRSTGTVGVRAEGGHASFGGFMAREIQPNSMREGL